MGELTRDRRSNASAAQQATVSRYAICRSRCAVHKYCRLTLNLYCDASGVRGRLWYMTESTVMNRRGCAKEFDVRGSSACSAMDPEPLRCTIKEALLCKDYDYL